MTNLRVSQLASINVLGGVATLNVSQLGFISVSGAPSAVGFNASQLFAIVVAANGQSYDLLNNAIQLSCWTPCGVLMWNGV